MAAQTTFVLIPVVESCFEGLFILSFMCFPDFNGVELTQSQNTPVAVQKEDTYIFFGTDVHIQKPIEMLAYGESGQQGTEMP